MMRSIVRTIAFAAATASATAAFAADVVTVDVPFNFNSHGVSYPAGKYDVSLNQDQTLVTMASKSDVKKQFVYLTKPVHAKADGHILKINFDNLADGSRELRTIQISERVTSVLDGRGKHMTAAEAPFTLVR
ncbi:MAG: hypothetical protein HIU87_13280 [Acidobacteria bacterium]|nr:hypothetical protein [Acidobacteriota bacterium]